MTIEFRSAVPSTQNELVTAIKSGVITPPFCLVAGIQTEGIGSRGNGWEGGEGNLAFSFCVKDSELAADVPQQSASIYFAMIMQEFLCSCGSKVWLKWPNDFYIGGQKIGGVMTNKIKNVLICGIGINIAKAPEFAGILDVKITPNDAVAGFLTLLENKISWKQIFSKFSLQFHKSQNFSAHVDTAKILLEGALLCEDGSIIINGERVYSLR